MDLTTLAPDVVFDGGDLDCGSGLALLIREHMLRVPVGGVLEVRSRERTVRDDLPPWCRVSRHEYLGALPIDAATTRYFVRRGAETTADAEALERDRTRSRSYEWRVRGRATAPMRSTVYCRNLSFPVGQPASFEERDEAPCAVEYVLGALVGALLAGFAAECSRDGLALDDLEASAKGRLAEPLAVVGGAEGDPSFAQIELTCYASTFADEAGVRAAWARAVARSPLVATLRKATPLDLRLAIV